MQGRPSSSIIRLAIRCDSDLGLLVVGGEVLARVLVGLVDDLAVGVAEDAEVETWTTFGDLRLQRRAEDAFGPGHVRLVHRRMLGGGNPDLVHRGDVDHRIAALQPGADRLAVAEIATDELAAHRGQLFALLRVADQADDVVAALAQLAHDLAADEAGASGNEDLHGARQPILIGRPARPDISALGWTIEAKRPRPRRAMAPTAPASPTRGRDSVRSRSASSTERAATGSPS